jgi:hypothetical protein
MKNIGEYSTQAMVYCSLNGQGICRIGAIRMNHYYTKEDIVRLLESDIISDDFRQRIETALEDGSESAIQSLGHKGRTALPQTVAYQVSPPVHKLPESGQAAE